MSTTHVAQPSPNRPPPPPPNSPYAPSLTRQALFSAPRDTAIDKVIARINEQDPKLAQKAMHQLETVLKAQGDLQEEYDSLQLRHKVLQGVYNSFWDEFQQSKNKYTAMLVYHFAKTHKPNLANQSFSFETTNQIFHQILSCSEQTYLFIMYPTYDANIDEL